MAVQCREHSAEVAFFVAADVSRRMLAEVMGRMSDVECVLPKP